MRLTLEGLRARAESVIQDGQCLMQERRALQAEAQYHQQRTRALRAALHAIPPVVLDALDPPTGAGAELVQALTEAICRARGLEA